ncbi:hypothetical protein [Sulfitobacter sp. S190]|uniref:hypothetical protein n=1 Tax=Sulfitobacter sp. S190 TaxID=2867022 RepID=UPI0021A2D9E6|nr:hypothetical protein [Sulfitobacter sp. S190]UWR24573.1 hypothetical protein K3756_19290 [Sulfitobacter sp. S190]
MTWLNGFVFEPAGCGQSQGIAEYFNGPSLFMVIPNELPKVVCCDLSREVPNPKVPNDPVGVQFRFGWWTIFELDP